MSEQSIIAELRSEFAKAGDPDPRFVFEAYNEASFGDAVLLYEGSLGTMRIIRDRGVYLIDVRTADGDRPIEDVDPAVRPLVARQDPLSRILLVYMQSR